MSQPIWNTPAGTLGTFPAINPLLVTLSASPVSPATTVTYKLLSGTLPTGLAISTSGVIAGTPPLVTELVTNIFTIRATDNLGNLRDRTFSMSITGTAIPQFTTPTGTILTTLDSVWIDLPITYSNPDSNNQVVIELQEGVLPPGLEINNEGIIRGYAEPPILNSNSGSVQTVATVTNSVTNAITCISTSGFRAGRPVTFTRVIGNIVQGTTYFIKTVLSPTSFTISSNQGGSTFILSDDAGYMKVLLPAVSVGTPTIRTYSFTLKLFSLLGTDQTSYNIKVINQNASVNVGGPGNPPNTRVPTILNTRPLSYNIDNSYYGYYVLPPVAPTTNAFIGTIKSGELFAFKILGYDFDDNTLMYAYSGLPTGLTGDTNTGWITGTPTLSVTGINNYSFTVSVYKVLNGISSANFNFSYTLSNEIVGDIEWLTLNNLGTIDNGTVSTLSVVAKSDVSLSYRLVGGQLPPNLTLLDIGEITGKVAYQPTDTLLPQYSNTEYTFVIEAYSSLYPSIASTRTFTLVVYQQYEEPTNTLYIKATPSLNDRNIINSLLTNTALIPDSMVYRLNDIYFGKATNVVYEHAYGIYSNDIDAYLEAVTKNHYWRNITLGELKTAVAKNSSGEIIYEVVYSEVIDNLVNPQGVSVPIDISWERPIDLNLGPWYTSMASIFTSYAEIENQEYYTSLSPGSVIELYPNSLYNMRTRVAERLGQVLNSSLLPLWMTSQQSNGSTLGYTQAWVICYTKPGYSDIIKTNIETNWSYKLNIINFGIDRFTVDKSDTYDYDTTVIPAVWTDLPSATPVPNPLDSEDFYVLFPQTTILPNK